MELFAPAPSPSAPADDLRSLIALTLVPGVGPTRVRALLAAFGSATTVLQMPARRLMAVEGVGPQTAKALAAFQDWDEVDRQLDAADRCGAWPLALSDNRYPRLLAETYDPPPLLWVLGLMPEDDSRALAIVGTRRVSAYGRRAAERFGFDVARAGWTVVSGLAYGVDAAAHQAALDAGGRTVAVLGSGVDRIYPSRHTRLARAIVDGGGAVLSEFPLGTKPDATNFPRRNRIVAGLSRGVLVAEAHTTGGALITAHCALGQNREVFAVPAPLFGDVGQGANGLIQQGAGLAESAEAILAVLEPQLGDAPTPATTPSVAPPLPVLTRAEQAVYDVLTGDPLHIDALSEAAGLETPNLLVTLLGLEFKGLVRQLAGKQFSRA